MLAYMHMSNEYWQKIQAAQAARASTQNTTPKAPESPSPIVENERARQKIKDIFEDIRRNFPEIVNAPQSRVRVEGGKVVLEWGDKLQPTAHETQLISQEWGKNTYDPKTASQVITTFSGKSIEVEDKRSYGYVLKSGNRTSHGTGQSWDNLGDDEMMRTTILQHTDQFLAILARVLPNIEKRTEHFVLNQKPMESGEYYGDGR